MAKSGKEGKVESGRPSRARNARFSRFLGCALSCLLALSLGALTPGCGGGGGSSSSSGEPIDDGMYSLSFEWNPVDINEDGSDLQDLAGYRLYDGGSPGTYNMVTDVGDTTITTLDSLSAGTYYFAVTAYDSSGNESAFSNELAVTVGREGTFLAGES